MSIFHYNTKSDLPPDIVNGNVYYTADGNVYLDKDSKRCKLNLSFLKAILEKFLEILNPDEEITPPKTGSISIRKTVDNSSESTSFNFTAAISNLADGTYGDVVFTNGRATFTLVSNQTKLIQNIPVGLAFSITETLKSNYTTPIRSWSGTVSETTYSINSTSTYVEPEPETLGTYSFAFLSDTHKTGSYSELVRQIKAKGVTLLIHGGDYVDKDSASTLKTEVNNYKDSSYTYLVTRGNHDGTSGGNYDQFLTESEVCSAMGKNPPYYYYDVPDKKLRFIILNAHDRSVTEVNQDPQHYYAYGPNQMKWLCGTALKVSEPGWKAILVSHTPLAPDNTMDNWGWGSSSNENWDGGLGRWYIANKVISACNRRSSLTYTYQEGIIPCTTMNYTFSDNNSVTIIGALSGHVHLNSMVMVNGVPNIAIESVKDSPVFDYITVNLDSGELKVEQWNSSGSTSGYTITCQYTSSTGSNTGTEVPHTSSGGGGTTPSTTYDYNCIVFDKLDSTNYGLRYIAKDRTSANSGQYLKDVSGVDIDIKTSGSSSKCFHMGRYLATHGSSTYYTGSLTVKAVDNTTYYKLYFENGYYLGYSEPSSSTMTNPASDKSNDFFGVQDNTYTV